MISPVVPRNSPFFAPPDRGRRISNKKKPKHLTRRVSYFLRSGEFGPRAHQKRGVVLVPTGEELMVGVSMALMWVYGAAGIYIGVARKIEKSFRPEYQKLLSPLWVGAYTIVGFLFLAMGIFQRSIEAFFKN